MIIQKHPFSIIAFLGILAISLSSCAASKMAKYMQGHQMAFQEALSGSLSQEEKLDVVANSLVTALEEAMTYSSIKKSVKHVDQFSKKNEKALNILTKELEGWVNGMSQTEKFMMIPQIASKPYTGRLIELIPKFEKKVNRRIQTFKIASKVIGLVKPNFL